MRERSIAKVPRAALALLSIALAAQLAWHAMAPAPKARPLQQLAAPSLAMLRIASLGDPIALSKALMLYVQAGDNHAAPDVAALTDWLTRISTLDAKAQYPLFIASHVFAEGGNAHRKRQMLEFVHQRFLDDPNTHWGSEAYIATVAKHQLHDLPLALRYARALRQLATGPKVPLWAQQMEVFVLEDMNELESARILLGGMLASGQLTDPNERRFLSERLKTLSEGKENR